MPKFSMARRRCRLSRRTKKRPRRLPQDPTRTTQEPQDRVNHPRSFSFPALAPALAFRVRQSSLRSKSLDRRGWRLTAPRGSLTAEAPATNGKVRCHGRKSHWSPTAKSGIDSEKPGVGPGKVRIPIPKVRYRKCPRPRVRRGRRRTTRRVIPSRSSGRWTARIRDHDQDDHHDGRDDHRGACRVSGLGHLPRTARAEATRSRTRGGALRFERRGVRLGSGRVFSVESAAENRGWLGKAERSEKDASVRIRPSAPEKK